MGIYMVERLCPRTSIERLRDTQRAMIAMSLRFTARGEPIRYLRSTYIPGESRCLCMFEAPQPESVKELNEVIQVPFIRIIEVMEIAPEITPE